MQLGKVKWFCDAKGFGFLRPEPDDIGMPDVFVHYSRILMPGFKTLETGQEVEFEAEQGEKGTLAKWVAVR